MREATKIMRSSIHAFLQSYHSYTSIAALLILPASASILLSQPLVPSATTTLQTISSRLHSLFEAAGFPAASQIFSLLNIKISQTILSFLFSLPFTLTFLILAKASVVRTIVSSPSPSPSLLRLYSSVLVTDLFNSFIILSANAAIFSLMFLAFNAADVLGLPSSSSFPALSAASAVLYSLLLANTMVTCNLAIVVAAAENCSATLAILEACLLIRGRAATALTLAVLANLSMAAVEALFLYRVVKPYHLSNRFNPSVIWEGFTITYMYSLLIVLDIIMSCMFYKSCKLGCPSDRGRRHDDRTELEPEQKGGLLV